MLKYKRGVQFYKFMQTNLKHVTDLLNKVPSVSVNESFVQFKDFFKTNVDLK